MKNLKTFELFEDDKRIIASVKTLCKNEDSISKAIAIGKAFKAEEKNSNSVVTDKLRKMYQDFKKEMKGLTDKQKDFVNSEIRKK